MSLALGFLLRTLAARRAALLSLVVTLLAAIAILQLWDAPARTRQFPLAVALPMLLLGLSCLTRDLLRPVETREASSLLQQGATSPRHLAGALGWVGAFFGALWGLGFDLALPVFTFSYLRWAAGVRTWLAGLLAGCTWLFYWLLFRQLVRLPTLPGALWSWLGMS